uniref:Secreted protein n=2 Tax=Ixodes ricinus TaxID=34613 RepID=V5H985_IXORI
MACRIWYGTVLVTYLCAVLVESGSLRKQRCDAERFLRCFANAVDVIIFPDAYDFKSLAKDCRVLDSVDSCTQYMEIGGCSDESKQWFQYLKSDFASLRSHICDPNLHTRAHTRRLSRRSQSPAGAHQSTTPILIQSGQSRRLLSLYRLPLTRHQTFLLYQARSGALLPPTLLKKMYPQIPLDPECTLCHTSGTLSNLLWDCPLHSTARSRALSSLPPHPSTI